MEIIKFACILRCVRRKMEMLHQKSLLQTTGTDPGFFSSWDLPLLPTPDFFPVGIYLFLFTPALFSC